MSILPRIRRSLWVGLGVLALGVGATGSLAGCYDDPEPVYAEGYQPQYYDGYVVYYDDGGRPYYYANGAVFWVPPASPFYIGLTNHWHTYHPAYRRWYVRHGYRYRGYRRR